MDNFKAIKLIDTDVYICKALHESDICGVPVYVIVNKKLETVYNTYGCCDKIEILEEFYRNAHRTL